MSDSDWEVELVELLAELSSVQDALLQVLDDKRARMAENDVAGMRDMQGREDALAERLEACMVRRARLLERASSDGSAVDNLHSLAQQLKMPNRGKVRRQVKDVSRRMQLLQHQGIANWVLAQRSLLHLSQMLEIIATGGRLKPTYGSSEHHHARGALVDREA